MHSQQKREYVHGPECPKTRFINRFNPVLFFTVLFPSFLSFFLYQKKSPSPLLPCLAHYHFMSRVEFQNCLSEVAVHTNVCSQSVSQSVNQSVSQSVGKLVDRQSVDDESSEYLIIQESSRSQREYYNVKHVQYSTVWNKHKYSIH